MAMFRLFPPGSPHFANNNGILFHFFFPFKKTFFRVAPTTYSALALGEPASPSARARRVRDPASLSAKAGGKLPVPRGEGTKDQARHPRHFMAWGMMARVGWPGDPWAREGWGPAFSGLAVAWVLGSCWAPGRRARDTWSARSALSPGVGAPNRCTQRPTELAGCRGGIGTLAEAPWEVGGGSARISVTGQPGQRRRWMPAPFYCPSHPRFLALSLATRS